jgi:hypothetical protein
MHGTFVHFIKQIVHVHTDTAVYHAVAIHAEWFNKNVPFMLLGTRFKA